MTIPIQKIAPEERQEMAIRRVLVVDDSRLQRKILSSSLSKWGFEVSQAASGDEALEMCKERSPDLILSDWMMPGLNGIEFCKAFRELATDRYGYFILLTSKSEKGEIAEGLQAGADNLLTKPVNGDELRARIGAAERILRMERELQQKNRIISSTLLKMQDLHDSIDNDLQEAKKLQESLVRERERDLGNAQLSMLLRSSGHVGGDLVGFFPIDETRVGLFGIDVSGHGITSALMTARLAGYLSAASADLNVALKKTPDGKVEPRSPAEAITKLNSLVLEEMETEHYFTLLLGILNLETGEMVASQAGHPHPAIQRANGSVEFIGYGGLPVGLIPGAEFEDFECRLSPGDRMLILSDGVTECPNPAGDLFDDDGLEAFLRAHPDVSGAKLLETLVWELARFADDEDFPDDVSGVLLEFSGQPSAAKNA